MDGGDEKHSFLELHLHTQVCSDHHHLCDVMEFGVATELFSPQFAIFAYSLCGA
jgi:hypothetical protein